MLGVVSSAHGQAVTTLATQASAAVVVGGTFSDTATLSGGASPTGTITFTLFGPNDATCSLTPVDTETVTVNGNGSYATPVGFTPTMAGTYRWIANYSGDANNAATANVCNGANESVVVSVATPALSTQASAGVVLGGKVSDTATLSGGASPTGTITFRLFGPNDATCSLTPVDTETVMVNGNGSYATPVGFMPTMAGTYRWIANYSGDANNAATANVCNGPNESVVVSPVALTTLTTQASAAVVVGGKVSDTATLSGGASPTGTITFTLFGPNDATCSLTPVDTETVTVNGNGSYTTPVGFTPTVGGTYRWIANYSGDANNAATANVCNGANESVVVSVTTPALSTQASAGVVLGGKVSDTATLSGGASPTGTITFTLFGPQRCDLLPYAGGYGDGHGERQRQLRYPSRVHADGGGHLPLDRQL